NQSRLPRCRPAAPRAQRCRCGDRPENGAARSAHGGRDRGSLCKLREVARGRADRPQRSILRQSPRADHRAGGSSSSPYHLLGTRIRGRRRLDQLWPEPRRCVPPGQHLCGAHPARGEARRSSGAAAHQVRARGEPQDCQRTGPRGAAHVARARRRGHRMKTARVFFALFVAFGLPWLPLAANAHQAGKLPRLGWLGNYLPTFPAYEGFREGLRELGYVEGKNIIIEARWAEGNLDRVPELARELVRLNVDVLYVGGDQGLRAAKQATEII